jgi:hypothetical protein
LKECPECGKEYPTGQIICSFCRADFSLPENIVRMRENEERERETSRAEEENRRFEMEMLAIEKNQGGFCDSCRYFRKVDREERTGLCLRFPPQVGVTKASYAVADSHSFFPEVDARWWCGEFVKMPVEE